MRLYIAAQACLPILKLGLDYYGGWVSVIVYPEGFWSPHRSLDTAGVLHSGYQARVGEAWDPGPIVLSWADVQQAADGEGFNVVIHECAHKLDLLNGVANGMPPLHGGTSLPAWTQAFAAADDELCQCLDRGAEPPIHPYAAESPGVDGFCHRSGRRAGAGRRAFPPEPSPGRPGCAPRRGAGCALRDVPLNDLQVISPYFTAEMAAVWDFERSVEQRSATGGTSRGAILAQIEALREAKWPVRRLASR